MATYDGRERDAWLEELGKVSADNVRHLLALFALLGIPESYLDVGCGDGSMVNAALRLGVRAFGVDQLVEKDTEVFFHKNLVDPFRLKRPVAMVTCFEVAEHLHESSHATLCETLAGNLEPGREHYLIFTAAYPGQGGNGHISERPAAYWHNEFSLRGLNHRRDLTINLALLWSNINSPLSFFPANVMVFEK